MRPMKIACPSAGKIIKRTRWFLQHKNKPSSFGGNKTPGNPGRFLFQVCETGDRSSKTGYHDGVQVYLANPRGFCAGVDRAIEIVERALEMYGIPIYVRHEVVHNQFVV